MRLSEIRKENNLSQCDVAGRIGISQPSYCNIENGSRRPSVDVAKKIGAVLGFDWTLLFEDRERGGANDGA